MICNNCNLISKGFKSQQISEFSPRDAVIRQQSAQFSAQTVKALLLRMQLNAETALS